MGPCCQSIPFGLANLAFDLHPTGSVQSLLWSVFAFEKGLHIQPHLGDAVLWRNLTEDGQPDLPRALAALAGRKAEHTGGFQQLGGFLLVIGFFAAI